MYKIKQAPRQKSSFCYLFLAKFIVTRNTNFFEKY
nr:MAG TPA: hypothetical protein [Caudoviricetes sp.]